FPPQQYAAVSLRPLHHRDAGSLPAAHLIVTPGCVRRLMAAVRPASRHDEPSSPRRDRLPGCRPRGRALSALSVRHYPRGGDPAPPVVAGTEGRVSRPAVPGSEAPLRGLLPRL